ncbi:MFS transporter [Desulfogranum mediterraneum]|uniref:MFS transporter n=1 Tax=Desulfogranum mediterraneum TaxID=160661 RepID=UPI00040C41E7|nr:MFS transporter [Desulfogranum mediterraneum]
MSREHATALPFLGLCSITFVLVCTSAVLSDLHWYLQSLRFSPREAGLLIGLFPLTSICMYAGGSRYITADRGSVLMPLGLVLTSCSMLAYLSADSLVTLALIRILGGIGSFLVMASCMAIMVTLIPAKRSGLAFSLYSVAMLLPYALMPAISEATRGWFPQPALLYALSGVLLLPAAGLAALGRRWWSRSHPSPAAEPDTEGEPVSPRRNLRHRPVYLILWLNSSYFFLFSSLFYLLKGYAAAQATQGSGYFFTIQMSIMVLLRFFGSSIFDRFAKEALIQLAVVITSLGFACLALGVSGAGLFASALLFGLGMGLWVPPLNALMYLHTPPQYRGYNANMMLQVMHIGSFAGVYGGSWLITLGGYTTLWLTILALLALNLGLSRVLRQYPLPG